MSNNVMIPETEFFRLISLLNKFNSHVDYADPLSEDDIVILKDLVKFFDSKLEKLVNHQQYSEKVSSYTKVLKRYNTD